MAAWGDARHEFLLALGPLLLGTRVTWWTEGSERLWEAGVHPRPARREKKVGKQNQPGLHHANAWLPGVRSLPRSQSRT